MRPSGPYLSVIVPAHQAAAVLPVTLQALLESDLRRECWELIVVDDASSDNTAAVASQYADTVVRLSGRPHGPAFARNRGFEFSRGEVLVFVDADVRVHPDALRSFAELFTAGETLGAVFGSYDSTPPAPGLISRYRNLLHHYHHNRGAGKAGTFWAGLGAVRRSVFVEVDKFDEWHYQKPQIEDIELGRRIRRSGYDIVLDPTIQGAHLKQWKFGSVVRTDLMHRGIPWMRLILREGGGDDLLNVRFREKVCVGLTALAALSLVVGFVAVDWRIVVAGFSGMAIVVFLNLDLYRFMSRIGGAPLVLATLPMHLLYYFVGGLAAGIGNLLHLLGVEPSPSSLTRELAARDLKVWPPVPARPRYSIWNPGRGESGAA